MKHVSTCWLSLEYAVDRTLQQYSGLKSYFVSTTETQTRFQRLTQHFHSDTTEVCLMFFQAIIPAFTTLNRFLRETPCVHVIHENIF